MADNRPLDRTEYAALVARVREAVARTVPAGASVLVISKGDSALLDIPGLRCAHFPQDPNGQYAGHHPHDSAAATGHLEELRRTGAGYLVIPATARWWLEHYDGFARHLTSQYSVAADEPDVCLIYRLGQGQGTMAETAPEATSLTSQLGEFLESLLPSDATVVVLDDGDTLLLDVPNLSLRTLDPKEGKNSKRLFADLAEIAAAGSSYLVLPRASEELDEHPDLVARIEEDCSLVADQRHLCRVFDLAALSGASK